MTAYSHPNPADDTRCRMAYIAAAEPIGRLDAYLDHGHGAAQENWHPADLVRVVLQGCTAALETVGALEGYWTDNDPLPETWMRSGQNPSAGIHPVVAKTTEVTMQALRPMLSDEVEPVTGLTPMPKWHVMCILSSAFFLRVGVFAQALLEQEDFVVGNDCVEILQGCIDAGMGMVYELNEANWEVEQEALAQAMLAMRDHVISWRLECAGPPAVILMENVYDTVAQAIANAS
jgi:hypothetical protein